MDKQLKIRFLGGAGTVTGSKTLLKTPRQQVLIDCGLFQGLKDLRRQNWDALPVPASEIDTVLITHGHLDHVGYLPRLVASGFRGKIRATAPTCEVASIVLRDSARIQEEDAARANRKGYSRHHPAKPLYTLEDAEQAIGRFEACEPDTWIPLDPDLRIRFRPNGHIIGSALIELDYADQRIVFSGDLGRQQSLLLDSPYQPKRADYLILESTYGDRLHEEGNIFEELKAIVNATCQKGGALIIPSFTVERAQELTWVLSRLKVAGEIPDIPIALDSPMGVDVTEVMERFPEWLRLNPADAKQIRSQVSFVESTEASIEMVKQTGPKIVIAGSGMVTGGRVLHYLKQHLGDPASTVLLVGYQAIGTRGRSLQEGCHELRFFGEYYPVKAQIAQITSLSAHADQRELLEWLHAFDSPPSHIFLNHGEAPAAEALLLKIRGQFPGSHCKIARMNAEYALARTQTP